MLSLTTAELARYARQTVLPEVGPEGQARLKAARVLCVGAGGLGAPAMLYLAAAGVGHLGVIDGDRVELSNLQRQVLYTDLDLGRPKAEIAAARIAAVNQFCEVRAYPVALDAANALEVLRDYDVILDGTDNFSTKFLLNDMCVHLGLPLIYGSVSQFQGQVSIFWAKRGPCYRCLHPSIPIAEIRNCAEAGVLGAVTGTVGSLQALEAIKLVLECGEPMLGRLLVFDGLSGVFDSFSFEKNPRCPVCSIDASAVKFADAPGMACPAPLPETTSIPMASLILDVRTAREWAQTRIPGALHLPIESIEAGENPAIDADRECVVYCQSGVRSARAARLLLARGYSSVRSLAGGLAAWSGPREEFSAE